MFVKIQDSNTREGVTNFLSNSIFKRFVSLKKMFWKLLQKVWVLACPGGSLKTTCQCLQCQIKVFLYQDTKYLQLFLYCDSYLYSWQFFRKFIPYKCRNLIWIGISFIAIDSKITVKLYMIKGFTEDNPGEKSE